MLRDNRLLWTLSVFAAAYWITGVFVPGAQLTALASILLLFGGLITLSQYAPVAWRIVFLKLRNGEIPHGYGAHLAVLGTTLLAAGAVWSGFATALWVYNGSPPAWLDTPYMGFGRYMMAGGFVLAHVSPSMTREGILVTRGWALWLAAITILVFGIFLGLVLARPDLVTARAFCVVKGNASRYGKLYHTPLSPQYAATRPEACFSSAPDAQMAGYRPAQR